MEFSAKQIAAFIQGEIIGDENATVDFMLQRNVACSRVQRKRYLLTVENILVRFGDR